MAGKRVATNFEGVYVDTHRFFVEQYNRWRPDEPDYGVEDIVEYAFEDTPWSLEFYLDRSTELWQKRWGDMPAKEPHAAQRLDRLKEHPDVDQVILVTAREDSIEEMRSWIDMQGVQPDEFHVEPEKGSLDIDVLIDDAQLYLGTVPRLFLYDNPWNEDVQLDGGDRRVHDLSGAYELLDIDMLVEGRVDGVDLDAYDTVFDGRAPDTRYADLPDDCPLPDADRAAGVDVAFVDEEGKAIYHIDVEYADAGIERGVDSPVHARRRAGTVIDTAEASFADTDWDYEGAAYIENELLPAAELPEPV